MWRSFKNLLEKYITKILFGWNNRNFEDEYLRKLEKNRQD